MEQTQSWTELVMPYIGTWKGFSPTDESPCMMGELKISIQGSKIVLLMATGLEVREEVVLVEKGDLQPLTREDLEEVYVPGSDMVETSTGFVLNGMKYVFHKGRKGRTLVLRGGLGDCLGPTILVGPELVKKGEHKKIIRGIQITGGKGCIPLLDEGGRVSKSYKGRPGNFKLILNLLAMYLLNKYVLLVLAIITAFAGWAIFG